MGFDTIEINLVFSQIRSEGGVIKSQFFPKFKIVYIILGGEGVKKIMDFFHNFGTFRVLRASLSLPEAPGCFTYFLKESCI